MNDIVNTSGLIIGIVISVLSAVFAFINRDRYKTLINDIYKPGNTELREQIAGAREEIKSLEQDNATLATQVAEKENTINVLREANSKQPDFTKIIRQSSDLSRQISTNHKELTSQLTSLTKSIVEKFDGGQNPSR